MSENIWAGTVHIRKPEEGHPTALCGVGSYTTSWEKEGRDSNCSSCIQIRRKFLDDRADEILQTVKPEDMAWGPYYEAFPYLKDRDDQDSPDRQLDLAYFMAKNGLS